MWIIYICIYIYTHIIAYIFHRTLKSFCKRSYRYFSPWESTSITCSAADNTHLLTHYFLWTGRGETNVMTVHFHRGESNSVNVFFHSFWVYRRPFTNHERNCLRSYVCAWARLCVCVCTLKGYLTARVLVHETQLSSRKTKYVFESICSICILSSKVLIYFVVYR